MSSVLRLLFSWLALATAVVASLFLATQGTYEYRRASTEFTGDSAVSVQRSGSATFADVNGAGVLLLLAVPIIITSIPLAMRRSHRRAHAEVGAGLLMIAFVILGMASVGMLFIPAALLATAAAGLGLWERRSPAASRRDK